MRDGAKNEKQYSMIFQKCIETDMFHWIRHCVAEVCAPLSALLGFKCFFFLFLQFFKVIKCLIFYIYFVITSTTEGEGGYIFTPFCLSVCLFVCLCTGYLKKFWTDPDEVFVDRFGV